MGRLTVPIMDRIIRTRRTEIGLTSRWGAVLFMIVVALSAVVLAWEAVRTAAAETLVNIHRSSCLRWAVELDPNNPSVRDKLGQYYLYSMKGGDLREAIRQFRRATELSPQNANYWLDLSTGCGSSGNEVCAHSAFRRTIKLSPMTPRFEWAWALQLLATNRSMEALPHLRRVLKLDASYASQVFRVSPWALNHPHTVLQKLLPAASGNLLKLDYLNFLCAHGKTDSAYFEWTHALAGDKSVQFASIRTFLDQLIDQKQIAEATTVWRDLEGSGIIRHSNEADKGNLVYNGNFTSAPLNGGYGWRVQKSPYLALAFRSLPSSRGNHGLRIDFIVPRNDEFRPLYQYVPVNPQTPYLLSARMQSANISSDSGPRVRVVDPLCDACLDVLTESSVGTSGPHTVSRKFKTGENTRLVCLEVWRPRSVNFPADITGTFWLQDVSLIALPRRPRQRSLN